MKVVEELVETSDCDVSAAMAEEKAGERGDCANGVG